jgi:hypothetical protein
MFFKSGTTVKYDDGVLKIDIGEIYPSSIESFNFEIKLKNGKVYIIHPDNEKFIKTKTLISNE